MFLSHEKSPSKMKFSKPNILRKTNKCASKPILQKPNKNACVRTDVSSQNWVCDEYDQKVCKEHTKDTSNIIRTKKDTITSNEVFVQRNDTVVNGNDDNNSKNIFLQINNNVEYTKVGDENAEIVSEESFKYNDLICNIQEVNLKQNNTDVKWCYIPMIDDTAKRNLVIQESCPQSNNIEIINSCEKIPPVQRLVLIDGRLTILEQKQDLVDQTALFATEQSKDYICDVGTCKKSFPTEQKLKKHKHSHKRSSTKVFKAVECPAYKSQKDESDSRELCKVLLNSREELQKHLKECHTLDDAVYRCVGCGRGFFWSGLVRGHAAVCGGPGGAGLACGWPGCGRVFRQPCRLREHTRAHTGDKPYPCTHPGCGWSFRTASKLVRHSLQHSGERRHRCERCGRAFLRREHLRHHAARHDLRDVRDITPRRRRNGKLVVPEPVLQVVSPGTTETENETPVLEATPTAIPTQSFAPLKVESDWSDGEDPFMCEVGAAQPNSGTAARTHCTWPLVRTAYVLEGDVQVELTEGTESKIYTIRSDLFLHGNILHSEDSESGVAGVATTCGVTSSCEEAPALDTDLGLLDTHSTIDLMQEELMYTDASVDETSYQLLSDGELHTFYSNSSATPTRQHSA